MIRIASVGITSTTFVSMLSTSSTQPPRYPAVKPIVAPTSHAIPPPSAPTRNAARRP